MKRVLLASLLVCVPVLSVCSREAAAQTVTGALVGTVTDSSGAAVAGAKVTAFDTKTNQSVTVTTASDGSYRIPNLDPDDYRIDVSAAGFQQISIAHTQLLLNATLRNDVQLKVGDTSEKVEVEATAGVISTENSSISSIIDVKAAERLPLNGRTIDRLIIFTAGMTSDSASAPNLSGSLRWGGAYYTVDGGNFNDLGNGAGAYSYATNLSSMPSTEVVQEMKIESNLAKAEFEGSSSISILTKSGTNAFHGELYELNRNRAYAARDYFARAGTTVKPQLNRNEFGGTVGGPIWKDKTFFFGSAEYLIQRSGRAYTYSVATDAMRSGDFSAVGTIKDPTTGLPFTGNKVSSIDPRAQALLAYYPRANQAGTGAGGVGNNRVDSVGTRYNVQRYTLKLDHRLNAIHTLTAGGTYSVGDPYFVALGTPPGYGNFNNAGYTTQSAFVRDNMTLTNNIFNELRYGYLSHRSVRVGQNTNFDPRTLFPTLYGPITVGGLPTINMTGFTALGDYGGSGHSPETTQQLTDNFTWVHGRHTFKTGANVNLNAIAIKNGTNSNVLGTFNFDGRYSGNAFADFLLGDPYSTVRSAPQIPIYAKYQQYGFYGQDDWNITRNLVLNFGLRYSMQSTPTEAHGDFTNFDFTNGKFVIRTVGGKYPVDTNQTTLSLYPGTYVSSEDNGWGSSVLTTDKKNFGPRFGFAYRPFSGDKTVIRGGYGIYYNFIPFFIGIRQLAQLNFPFTLTQSYTASSASTPTLTLANPFPGSGTVTANPSIYSVDRDAKSTRAQQWSLTVEQQLPGMVGFRISYVGNKATQAPWYLYNKNLPAVQRAAATLQSIRPYQPWSDILGLVTKGGAFTNQMQIEVTKRTGHGLFVQSSYTWNKSLDNVPIVGSPQNPYNPAGDKGLSDGIRAHNFFLNATYDLPFKGQGLLGGVISGWSLAGTSEFRSGAPFTPTFTSTTVGWYATRADVVPGVDPYAGAHTLSRWFNPSAFKVPSAFTFGNARRNSLIGPKENTVDFSIRKQTHLEGRFNLSLQMDAFNILNHPTFGTPAGNISVASTVGTITGTNGNLTNRQVQIGAKITY